MELGRLFNFRFTSHLKLANLLLYCNGKFFKRLSFDPCRKTYGKIQSRPPTRNEAYPLRLLATTVRYFW